MQSFIDMTMAAVLIFVFMCGGYMLGIYQTEKELNKQCSLIHVEQGKAYSMCVSNANAGVRHE